MNNTGITVSPRTDKIPTNTITKATTSISNSISFSRTVTAVLDDPVTWSSYIFVSFESVIFAVGVVGNLLTLALMAWRRYPSQVVTQIFIASLCCYNLGLMFGSALPVTTTTLNPDWRVGQDACKVYYLIQSASLSGAVWTLFLLALDRFLSMDKIGGLSFVGVRGAVVIVVLLLTYNLAYSIPLILYAFLYTVPPTIMCGLLRNASESMYIWATRFINFYVPLAAIWVVYLGIIYKFKKSSIKVANAKNVVSTVATGQHSRISQSNGSRRVTVVCVAIATLFTVCYLPFQIDVNLIAVGINQQNVTNGLKVMSWINSCGHPIIYCLMWRPMKSALKTLLGRITGRVETIGEDTEMSNVENKVKKSGQEKPATSSV